MTSEVGVMNRLGIALAADSAVTLHNNKIYTSAEKLFQLAENAPVGVLVYGAASLINVPWETIIKVYRRHLQGKTYPYLQDYADDFAAFLQDNEVLFPESEQETFIREAALSYYIYLFEDQFRNRLNDELQQRGELNEADLIELLTSIVEQEIQAQNNLKLLNRISEDLPKRIEATFEKTVKSVMTEVFGDFPLSEEIQDALLSLFVLILTRSGGSPFDSGIVIAGFGNEQHFPCLIEHKVRGVILKQLLYNQNDPALIGINSNGYIVPFAQSEMVHTFMQGIDPNLNDLIMGSVNELFGGAIDYVLGKVKEQDTELARSLENDLPQFAQMLKQLYDKWEQHRRDYYSSPVMEIVASLPKDELAAMAEALVNLTKFKRRVSRDEETVGGPIDVAVITKGDGFVWIKRKHYFEAHLNPRFISKYYRGV